MSRRLLWPALRGGLGSPSGWVLYDGHSGSFKAMSLESLRDTEGELRAVGEVEMADAFGAQLSWLVRMAEARKAATAAGMAVRWASSPRSHP